MSDMDLKTRVEILPCGTCEDMMNCDDCYHQKDAKDIYQQIRADAIDEIHNMLHDRLCELSNQKFSQMSKNEYQRYASVLSELNKWLDTLEQLKSQN